MISQIYDNLRDIYLVDASPGTAANTTLSDMPSASAARAWRRRFALAFSSRSWLAPHSGQYQRSSCFNAAFT